MVRPAYWFTSLAVGLALACEGSTAWTQDLSNDDESAPSSISQYDDGDATSTESDGDYQPSATEDEIPQDDDAPQSAADADTMPADEAADMTTDESTTDASQADEAPAEAPVSESIKERFPNGSVKIEREVTQDAQGNYVNHGMWKMWDQRGNLVAQGEYENGERTGAWVRWYRSATEADILSKMPYQQFVGPFISQATFKNGRIDGHWTIFDSKMRKISQWTFADGQRQGPSTWWYANGHKMREIIFRDGHLDGPFIEWTPDAKIKSKDTYQDGRKSTVKTTHHNGGAKKSEGTYLLAKEIEQNPDDWWNCKLHTMTKTGKDEKHGAWHAWYGNGQRQLEGAYEHDVQVGPFTWWHQNGQKALEGRFEGGKQDGSWTWWYPSGQKSIHGEYANGNPTGRWTWWKEDGKVAQSADLSQSEGVVIDSPKVPEPAAMPRMSKPATRTPARR